MINTLLRKEGFRTHQWFLLIATLLYLVVEFSFNARLLDVVGSLATADEIDSIEKSGRIISGFALALYILDRVVSYLNRRNGGVQNESWMAIVMHLFFISVICVPIVYYAEKKLVDSLVENSSAEQRKTGKTLALVQHSLLSGSFMLNDMEFAENGAVLPEEKTFLAVFPLIALTASDIAERIAPHKQRMLTIFINNQYGGLDGAWANYQTSVKEMKEGHAAFLEGSKRYRDALEQIIKQRQTEAWTQYTQRLQRHRWTPDTVPAKLRARVRQEVINSGVKVPANWSPNDQTSFERAIAHDIYANSRERFRVTMRLQFPEGENIEPGRDWPGFLSEPAIQAKWRNALKYPEGMSIPLLTDRSSFDQRIYKKLVETRVAETAKKMAADTSRYANGGDLADFGKDGMRAVLVPPVALLFSLLGALIHLWKTCYRLTHLVTGRPHLGKPVFALLFVLLIVLVHQSDNRVTEQTLYKRFEAKNQASDISIGGIPIAWAMVGIRTTIHLQRIAYPINEATRQHLLRGYTFGFTGKPSR